jgi:hypothetical protein
VGVCRWQTVEDGPPRDAPHTWGCYAGIWIEGSIRGADRVKHSVPVRDDITHGIKPAHVVIRGRLTDEEITVALEPYRPPDDGA